MGRGVGVCVAYLSHLSLLFLQGSQLMAFLARLAGGLFWASRSEVGERVESSAEAKAASACSDLRR